MRNCIGRILLCRAGVQRLFRTILPSPGKPTANLHPEAPMSAPSVTTSHIATSLKDALLPSLGAAALGIVLLFGAGFAPMEALHNAAHDSRHSAGFPCH